MTVICDCDNKECKGICREANLIRENRKKLQCCPAAVGDGYLKGRARGKK
jgi:hypothetical protein